MSLLVTGALPTEKQAQESVVSHRRCGTDKRRFTIPDISGGSRCSRAESVGWHLQFAVTRFDNTEGNNDQNQSRRRNLKSEPSN